MNHILLRVHIAVVGFEIERISTAAIQQKADRVYLISKKENDKGFPYLLENKKRLEGNDIEVIEEKINDIQNITDILHKIKEIIETEKNNLIYINISCGSNLSAIAGTISSMMFGSGYHITPYYVKPEKYLDCENREKSEYKNFPQLRTVGIKEIIEIVTFPAQLPNSQLIAVLKHLKNQKDCQIGKRELIQYVMKNPEIFPNYFKETDKTLKKNIKTSPKDLARAKDYAWINQNIINKLKNDWDMIEVKTIGKYSYIKLTKRGEDMLEYLT